MNPSQAQSAAAKTQVTGHNPYAVPKTTAAVTKDLVTTSTWASSSQAILNQLYQQKPMQNSCVWCPQEPEPQAAVAAKQPLQTQPVTLQIKADTMKEITGEEEQHKCNVGIEEPAVDLQTKDIMVQIAQNPSHNLEVSHNQLNIRQTPHNAPYPLNSTPSTQTERANFILPAPESWPVLSIYK